MKRIPLTTKKGNIFIAAGVGFYFRQEYDHHSKALLVFRSCVENMNLFPRHNTGVMITRWWTPCILTADIPKPHGTNNQCSNLEEGIALSPHY